MSGSLTNCVVVALLLSSFGAMGCSRDGERRPRAALSASAAAPASVPAPSASAAPVVVKRKPGTIPFDFPVDKTSAKEGEFVLAPLERWVDEAFVTGGEKQTFIYYGAWVTKVGDRETKLKTLPGQTESLPNALILPIGSGESASPGDVVLTAWASGSGLQRAIVVEGGTPTRPKVRYLDMELESASGWGQKDDELPEKTFRVLKRPGELGTTVACKDGSRHVRWVVVASEADRLLGLGFAGKMKVLQRSDCTNLPIAPSVRVAQKIFVPVVGVFVEAKITKTDAAVGRVFAKHAFGGTEQDGAFSFTNVALSL